VKSTIGLEKINELKSELEKALLANTALDLETPTEFTKMLKALSSTDDVLGRMKTLLTAYGKKSSVLIAPILRQRQPKFITTPRRRKCAICAFNIERGHLMLSIPPTAVCPLCAVLGVQTEMEYLQSLLQEMSQHVKISL
jgi:hypothetical protein